MQVDRCSSLIGQCSYASWKIVMNKRMRTWYNATLTLCNQNNKFPFPSFLPILFTCTNSRRSYLWLSIQDGWGLRTLVKEVTRP